MNTRRIATAAGVATGGALAAAFLSTGLAHAVDTDGGAGVGFTWVGDNAPVYQQTGFSLPGVFEQWHGDDGVLHLWPANFFDADGAPSAAFDPNNSLGSMTGDYTYTHFLGMTNMGYVVTDASGFTGDLPEGYVAPTAGSVYSVTNLGFGVSNVYSSVGTGDTAVATDILKTPFGNMDLSKFFSAIDASAGGPYAEGADVPNLYDAFGPPGTDGGGFTWVGDNAPDYHPTGFFLPGVIEQWEGNDGVLHLWPANFFDADGGTTAEFNPSESLGSMTGDYTYTHFLGMTDMGYVVTAADGFDASLPEGFDAPTVGSIYNVLNLGFGLSNVYSSIAGDDGHVVTDILQTPFGNADLSWLFSSVDLVGGPYTPGADIPDLYDAFGLADLLGGGGDFGLSDWFGSLFG